jgi:hypothetical protein
MRISREFLIRVAKETVQKRTLSNPGLVAAYLTGSLRSGNPFLGNTTDIDIVFVHAGQPKIRREILALTPEIHLDIIHNPRSQYEKPKELRIHPRLGPELYDPLPLYGTQHFFEFVQAGVRAEYDEPANVLSRARQCAEQARQNWSDLQLSQANGPALLTAYLEAVDHAANAFALLWGGPIAERRFLLQFAERTEAAGAPNLYTQIMDLLGGEHADTQTLHDFLPDWEHSFTDAAGRNHAHASIAVPRLAYYKQAFDVMLAGGSPQTILWPLVHTWTLAAAVLPPTHQVKWQSACAALGLCGEPFTTRLEGLDHFLDAIEEAQEKWAAGQGL